MPGLKVLGLLTDGESKLDGLGQLLIALKGAHVDVWDCIDNIFQNLVDTSALCSWI